MDFALLLLLSAGLHVTSGAVATASTLQPPPLAVRARLPAMVATSMPTGEEAEDTLGFIDDKPLSAPQRVVRALTFWSKVVPILGAYKAAEVYGERTGKSEAEMEERYQE